MSAIPLGPGMPPDLAGSFRDAVVDWFGAEGRSYPWRGTRDPYAILVSELMLQQTRIATVLERGYYERWMRRFPDWASLAAAEEEDVLKQWEGLGYYNRARNLQKAAKEVGARFGGEMPDSLEDMLTLPGVGRYTAGAVASFAFGMRAPIVDGNVVRVLARLTGCTRPVDSTAVRNEIWELAEFLTPEESVREYNSGIMEIGQTLCAKSNPDCGRCPVASFCRGREEGLLERIPAKTRKAGPTRVVERVGLLCRDSRASSAEDAGRGRLFVVPETGGRREGLWRLPELTEEDTEDLVEILRFDYAITRYKVDLRVFRIESGAGQQNLLGREPRGRWIDLAEPQDWPPLGSPFRKAIGKFLDLQQDSLPMP